MFVALAVPALGSCLDMAVELRNGIRCRVVTIGEGLCAVGSPTREDNGLWSVSGADGVLGGRVQGGEAVGGALGAVVGGLVGGEGADFADDGVAGAGGVEVAAPGVFGVLAGGGVEPVGSPPVGDHVGA